MSEGFVTNHRGEEVPGDQPRIVALQIDDQGQHFHKINYKKDLIKTLQKTVIFGQPGLLTEATFYEDDEKTIPVLQVTREYQSDSVTGKLLKKRTKRKHWNEDGTENTEIKDGGWYTYTPEESRAATHRRRENITNKLESDMLDLLSSSAQGDPEVEEQNIAAGAAFMAALSPEITKFHLSGKKDGIEAFVSNTMNHTLYPFLLADVAPGVKAYQFIIAGVTY